MKSLILILFLTCLTKRDDSVIVILCRNEDKVEIKKTIENFEEKFNNQHNYPYVFLNDKEWEDSFKDEIKEVTESDLTFGNIDAKEWNPPKCIDMNKAHENWKKIAKTGVPYAENLSYHNMCRFFSRKFFTHPLLKNYRYYWRIEPSVRFRCYIDKDPFEKMAEYGYVYGFTIALHEFMSTIPTLGDTTAKFLKEHESQIPPDQSHLNFMFENGTYNGCHFWSNFEIGDFEFFRGDLYQQYSNYLETNGGHYYERWGDAPIHSLGVALFADKSKINFFEEIGYTHPPFTHCPKNYERCDCKPEESFDIKPGSCLPNYLKDRMHG